VALLNEILAGRFNQWLTRKFNMTGGAPAPQLAAEVMPVTQLNDPPDFVLASENLASGIVDVAAVALKRGVAQLTNPAGSNTVITVERIECSVYSAGMTMAVGIGVNAPLAQNPAAGGVAYRDTRKAGLPAASLSFDQAPPTILAANYADVTLVINSSAKWVEPIVLGPNSCVQVSSNTNNTEFTASFVWRERAMVPGEVGPF
jgi:hypothetical protein